MPGRRPWPRGRRRAPSASSSAGRSSPPTKSRERISTKDKTAAASATIAVTSRMSFNALANAVSLAWMTSGRNCGGVVAIAAGTRPLLMSLAR